MSLYSSQLEAVCLLSQSRLVYVTFLCTHSSHLTLIIPSFLYHAFEVQSLPLNLLSVVLDWIDEFLDYWMGF